MFENITGIILSGGKSTRMGENKSFLDIGGKPAIDRTVDLMNSLFSNVILSTNEPEKYEYLNLNMVKDFYPGKGPLAGIHAGLKESTTDKNFIISCDMPLMNADIIKFIVEFETDAPITVCKSEGFVQQLAGVYSKSVLPLIEESLADKDTEIRADNQKKRKCKVLSLLENLGAKIIEENEIPNYSPDLFFNMNRKDDYVKILDKLKESKV